MKVAEKIGMKVEARIRGARMVDGEYYDAIKMGFYEKGGKSYIFFNGQEEVKRKMKARFFFILQMKL